MEVPKYMWKCQSPHGSGEVHIKVQKSTHNLKTPHRTGEILKCWILFFNFLNVFLMYLLCICCLFFAYFCVLFCLFFVIYFCLFSVYFSVFFLYFFCIFQHFLGAFSYFLALLPILICASCHKPRYWSTTDRYKATLLQGKQAQDTSLWFPYRFRAGRTVGKPRGHSLVQVPECGNEPNQSWESCTTIRQSGDQITQEKCYDFQEN